MFGRDAQELLEAEGGGEITVSGLIGEPRRHRGTRAGLVLVLNGRRVHNRALVAAVEEAYAGLLPVGRHPFGVVTISLDPALVDVNVHPTKREVRLRDEGRVFAAVERACWSALQGAHLSVAGVRQPQLEEASSGWRRNLGWELRDGPRDEAATSLLWPGSPAALGDGGGVVGSDRRAQPPPPMGDHRLAELAPMRPLAQAADGWLIANSQRGLCLVDPHAAHEKVLYVELMAAGDAARLAALPAPNQPLLIEATVSVDADAIDRLLEDSELLAAMGFELEAFGPGLVRCRGVPAAASSRDPERLVREVLDSLGEGGDASSRRRRLAALTACHAAVRLGDPLDGREQAQLLDRLVATPGGLTCPHGRPTVIVLADASLRRAFGRPAV